jgi:hypothetical protein
VRHRLLVVGALAAAVVTSAACGGDKAAPQQAVAWFGLGASASGASCSTLKTYQLPPDARATITGGSGAGERVKDGSDYFVDCDVRLAPSSTTNYNVSLKLEGDNAGVANFVATGVLPVPPSPDMVSTGNVDIVFTTGQFSLQQTRCTVDIKALVPGAVWLRNLHCDNLHDPSSPGIACDGLGGVIFENCAH